MMGKTNKQQREADSSERLNASRNKHDDDEEETKAAISVAKPCSKWASMQISVDTR